MLAAYRRTLQKTFEQARSMNQVVDSKVLPWLETPDQAVEEARQAKNAPRNSRARIACRSPY